MIESHAKTLTAFCSDEFVAPQKFDTNRSAVYTAHNGGKRIEREMKECYGFHNADHRIPRAVSAAYLSLKHSTRKIWRGAHNFGYFSGDCCGAFCR